MFNISVSNDITQLMIKRQMRNNQSVLFLIKGTNNIEETAGILKNYSSKCKEVFYQKGIEKPTYDEVQLLNSVIKFTKELNISHIASDIDNLFSTLSSGDKQLLVDSITQVFNECISNRLSKSMIVNGYIRCLNTLNNRLSKITYSLAEDNRILFVGKPDKYDILAFTVLGLCGVDVVICDFDTGMTSECMCVNRFVFISGQFINVNLDFLKFVDKGILDSEVDTVISNDWVNFNDYKTLDDTLKLIGFKVNDRHDKDKWKVLHLELQGVSDSLSYSQSLDNFMINLKASNRPFVLFDTIIPKSTYDEVEGYKKLKEKDIFSIFSKYSALKGTGIVVKIENIIETLVKRHNFTEDRKIENYKDTLKIWLIRYLDKFYKGNSIDNLPLILSFNLISDREKEFLMLLGCLPLDIISITPTYQVAHHTEGVDASYKCILLGESNKNIQKYPVNSGVGQVATTAYNAQQELNNVLYNDTSLFRIKQFRNVNPIVLKTTYEEVSIYWNEHAKFRPSFNSVGNLVTVPTIFVKVNGVNESYVSDVRKLLGKNTLLYQSFPIQLQPSVLNNIGDLRSFAKQLVFKDSIDFERLIKSPYYSYGVYSEETQQLIIDKVKKLVSMDWCNTKDKNLVYEIIDTVFRLPQNVLQMIHNYDFTGEIPKLVIFNGTTQPCTLSDCIMIMFLKLIGFDIAVFAPTGYRVIEQYISNQWFNENTIGQYDFNMTNINFSNIVERDNRKSGFFSRLFN